MKTTEALLAEHLVFHNLFDHIEQAAPTLKSTAEVRSLARLLESMLRAHSQTEENLVFPLAEQVLKAATLTELGETWMEQRKVVG